MINLAPSATGSDATFKFGLLQGTGAPEGTEVAQKGDVYTFKVSPLQTLTLTCTKTGVAGVAEFTVSMV